MPFIRLHGNGRSDLFFDLGSLTDSVAQIVEFCTSDITGTGDIDSNNVGRMDREGLLDSDSVRNTSYGESLGDSTAMLGNNGSLKHLNSLAGSFFDAVVNTHIVTDIDDRKLLFELLVRNSCNVIHYKPLLLCFKDNEDIHAEHAADCPRAPEIALGYYIISDYKNQDFFSIFLKNLYLFQNYSG